jgi:hypothetical protein
MYRICYLNSLIGLPFNQANSEIMRNFQMLIAVFSTAIVFANGGENPRLLKAHRSDKAGWIYVHLEGSPRDIGYQHGYLLANEIDTTIQAVSYWLRHETPYSWAFYRKAAKNFLWNKVDPEYKDEIDGMVEGLRAKHKKYDSLDITAYNAL